MTPLAIPDVILFEPKRFRDERGWFEETWNARRLADAGLTLEFVQDNQSLSNNVNTIRGLHFQIAPYAQAKLVRAVTGAIIDVAVDLRTDSPTYGKWVSAELTADNGRQLLVPRGFAHGFRTLQPETIVAYKVDGFYDKASERGIRFDDPDLAVDWGGAFGDAILSEKDAVLPAFRDIGPVFP